VDSGLTSSLPGGVLNTQPLPEAWVALFTAENITLEDPTVTSIVAGAKWRVDSGSLHYFIEKDGTVVNVRGEDQTFDLPAEYFSIEIVGGMRLQPAGFDEPIFLMVGGLLRRPRAPDHPDRARWPHPRRGGPV
jgi:hypothetical protein